MSLKKISDRQSCNICESIVFKSPLVIARGNPKSKLMLIGEAPGAKEEIIGAPFVGRSGKLLDKLLTSAGIHHTNDVYISNLIKTRPPNNRAPRQEEVSLHLPWLYQQIKLVNPLVIVLVGSSSLRAILGLKSKITKLRGTWHNWNGFYVIPIFHPSYILRNPSKSKGQPYDLTILDLLAIKKKLGELKNTRRKSSFIPFDYAY